MQFGQYPAPGHVIAHLSDTHVLADGVLQYGAVDTEAGVAQALSRLSRIDPPPQALVFTGDLADKAEPDAYRRLRAVVEPAAAAMGAEVIWVMGNHDERAAYARGLFDEDSDAPQDRVYDIDGLRVIALDTTVPGYHHGDLTAAQLSWLADLLATPAPYGTILALHHPPIPIPLLRAAELIELHDQQRLADVLAGTDVRCIIGGHFHFSSHSTFAGIPVSVASATCYTTDPAPQGRFDSGVDGHAAVNLLHVYDDRIVHSVVPVADAPEVTGHPIDVVPQIEALTPQERIELLSSKSSPLYADD